jgi:hypothetical protein
VPWLGSSRRPASRQSASRERWEFGGPVAVFLTKSTPIHFGGCLTGVLPYGAIHAFEFLTPVRDDAIGRLSPGRAERRLVEISLIQDNR